MMRRLLTILLLSAAVSARASNIAVGVGAGTCTFSVSALNYGAAPSCATTFSFLSTLFDNQGTTTQVLHGNAAGHMSFSSVVEGDLGLTNITTGNVSTTAHGFAPIAPNDTAKFLRGDATWATLPAAAAHNLLSASHTDTVAASPVRGDIIIANSTPAWTKLAIGASGLYHKSNGTDIVNSTLAASGVGACGAGLYVTTLNGDAVPTCGTPAGSGMTTSGSNAASTAVAADWTADAVNTRSLGSTTVPWVGAHFGESSTLRGFFGWSSIDTVHHMQTWVDSTNRTLALIDKANSAFNYAAASSADPMLKIYSHNQNTTQWGAFSHDGTNLGFTAGVGGFLINVTSASDPFIVLDSGGEKFRVVSGAIRMKLQSSAAADADFVSYSTALRIGGDVQNGATGTGVILRGFNGAAWYDQLKQLHSGTVTINNSTRAAPPLIVQDNGTAVLTVSDNGLLVLGGLLPTVSNTTANSCGTTAATLAGNESVGTITVGATAGTSCTITFGTAETNRRNCFCQDETAGTAAFYARLSATTGKCAGTFAAGAIVTYICLTY